MSFILVFRTIAMYIREMRAFIKTLIHIYLYSFLMFNSYVKGAFCTSYLYIHFSIVIHTQNKRHISYKQCDLYFSTPVSQWHYHIFHIYSCLRRIIRHASTSSNNATFLRVALRCWDQWAIRKVNELQRFGIEVKQKSLLGYTSINSIHLAECWYKKNASKLK